MLSVVGDQFVKEEEEELLEDNTRVMGKKEENSLLDLIELKLSMQTKEEEGKKDDEKRKEKILSQIEEILEKSKRASEIPQLKEENRILKEKRIDLKNELERVKDENDELRKKISQPGDNKETLQENLKFRDILNKMKNELYESENEIEILKLENKTIKNSLLKKMEQVHPSSKGDEDKEHYARIINLQKKKNSDLESSLKELTVSFNSLKEKYNKEIKSNVENSKLLISSTIEKQDWQEKYEQVEKKLQIALENNKQALSEEQFLELQRKTQLIISQQKNKFEELTSKLQNQINSLQGQNKELKYNYEVLLTKSKNSPRPTDNQEFQSKLRFYQQIVEKQDLQISQLKNENQFLNSQVSGRSSLSESSVSHHVSHSSSLPHPKESENGIENGDYNSLLEKTSKLESELSKALKEKKVLEKKIRRLSLIIKNPQKISLSTQPSKSDFRSTEGDGEESFVEETASEDTNQKETNTYEDPEKKNIISREVKKKKHLFYILI